MREHADFSQAEQPACLRMAARNRVLVPAQAGKKGSGYSFTNARFSADSRAASTISFTR